MSVKEQVKKLWKLCFDDPDDFVELYFRRRYSDDVNEAVVRDGKVVAALQKIPYPMTCFGGVIPTAYISGACTHPDFRSRGIMGDLLARVHRHMYENGIWLSSLIPAEEWLKGYYARFGYAMCFKQSVELLTTSQIPVDNSKGLLIIKKIDLWKTLPEEVYAFFYEQLRRQSCCILHTQEDWEIILADLSLAGGELWAAYHPNGDVSGVALCLYNRSTLSVKEMVCTDIRTEQEFSAFLFRHYSVDRFERIAPPGKNACDLGMARIIRVEALLRLFARAADRPYYIEVVGDEAIPENNDYYRLEHGICMVGYQSDVRYQKLTIGELTHFLFAGEYPYMNLMLN